VPLYRSSVHDKILSGRDYRGLSTRTQAPIGRWTDR
jgi:hypothetical protein